MEVKELRIGNVVTREGKTEVIDAFDFLDIEGNGDEDWNGILITKEWLLNLGYRNYKGDLYTNNGQDVELKSSETDFYFGEYGDWSRTIIYVHELQNLYYALTGSELVLKI